MANRKPWSEEEDFGVWDTSVSVSPSAERVEVPGGGEAPAAAEAQPAAEPEVSAQPAGKKGRKDKRDKDSALDRAPAAAPPREVRVMPSQAPDLSPAEMFDLGPTYTTIGPTLVIRGRLKCDENLVVHGRMEANVESRRVLRIEATGIVNANIDVKAAWIGGIVVGDIRATELVELSPEARVVGDIATPRLIVHDGASFRGNIEMDGLAALELVRPKPKIAAVVVAKPAPAAAAVAQVQWDEPAPTAPVATAAVVAPIPVPAPSVGRTVAPVPPPNLGVRGSPRVSATVQASDTDEDHESESEEAPSRVEPPLPVRPRPRGVTLPSPSVAAPAVAVAVGSPPTPPASTSASGSPPAPAPAPEPPPTKSSWFGRRH